MAPQCTVYIGAIGTLSSATDGSNCQGVIANVLPGRRNIQSEIKCHKNCECRPLLFFIEGSIILLGWLFSIDRNVIIFTGGQKT